MKLREHPLMTRKSGFGNWPPKWQPVGQRADEITDEVGVLEYVGMNNFVANKVFMAMRHLGVRYFAIMAFDDEMFAHQVHRLLLDNVGRTVEEVGDLDVSYLL